MLFVPSTSSNSAPITCSGSIQYSSADKLGSPYQPPQRCNYYSLRCVANSR
jgi:hypothetical protein